MSRAQRTKRWWAALPRLAHEADWPRVQEAVRVVYEQTVVGLARKEGATLRAGDPVAGYVTASHSRDGLSYPCQANTNGAEPAWIFYGETR